MKKLTSTGLVAAFLAAFAITQFASAQTTYIGTTNGTSQWTNTAIWSGGTVPNSTGAVVVFTNTATNAGVVWSNTNITVGTINFQQTTANVVIGDNSITNDTLTLATSSGKPVLNVSNSGGTAFVYATLLGTNGFTKTGAGNLSFRFNTTAMTYTGDINLNAGTLTINQDSSLGDTNNDIFVGGNATLSYSPGSNTGAGSLSAGRNISISNGTTLTLQTLNTNTPLTINGVISNSGALILVGTDSGTSAASSLSYTFNGANTYSGATTVRTGTKVFLGAGASLSTNAITFNLGSGSYYSLDVGGNTQNFANLTFGISSSVARTLAISNGTLNITAPTAQFSFSGANGTTFDLSGLTAYSFAGAAGGRNFLVRPDMTGGNVTNTAFLAAAGIGSNNISAGAITIGAASGTQNGTNVLGRLVLGKVNLLSANTMDIGAFNGSGLVEFGSGISGGSLVLRGSNGVSDMSTLTVGLTSSGARFGVGTLNLAGGSLDARVTNINIGNNTTGLADTSSITMPDGTVVAQNLRIGRMTGGTSSPNMTNSFNQGGGSVTATNIVLGENSTGAGAPNIIATYSNTGGTLYATSITTGSGPVGASTARTIALNGASATLRNIAGSNLTVDGSGTASTNRINVVLGASGGNIEADAGQSVTLGANTRSSGAGVLFKAGAGTLIIQGDNTHSGGTTLSAGTIEAGSDTALGTGTIGLNGGTLLASGAARSYTNAVSVGGNVALGGSGNGLTFSGPVNLGGSARTLTTSDNTTISGDISNGGLTKAGASTLTLSGNNTFAGALSANQGVLELATTGGSAAGSVASISVTNATLLVSQSNQVNSGATVSLSGGTISRASGVSETFGALNLTDASSLDFGGGASGNLTFGVYEGGATPSALLTVNNFFGGNTLTFGTDLSGYIDASYNGTAFTSDYFNINSVSGGFTSSWNGSTFTITAIPEPSTCLAATGLLGLMLWRRLRRPLDNAESRL